MARSSQTRSTKDSLPEALPQSVPIVLFLGGPFAGRTGSSAGESGSTLEHLRELSGDPDQLKVLFGPLGRVGFDPSKPGAVGLAKTPGTALFHGGKAVGLAAVCRSPKKWREALAGATRKPVRKLKVRGAAEAGIAELEENWTIAFARKPPYLYALSGFEGEEEVARVLEDLVDVSPGRSLHGYGPFRQAMAADGLQGDVVLWIGPNARETLGPDVAGWEAGDTGGLPSLSSRNQGVFAEVADFRGMAVGLHLDEKVSTVEGLVCAEGTLFEGLDAVARSGSRCVIGPGPSVPAVPYGRCRFSTGACWPEPIRL